MIYQLIGLGVLLHIAHAINDPPRYFIGKSMYKKTTVANKSAFKHIIVDNMQNIFYRDENYQLNIVKPHSSEAIPITGYDTKIIDGVKDSRGNIWIGTTDGLFKYNYISNSYSKQTVQPTDEYRSWWHMAVDADNSNQIFMSDGGNYSLHSYENGIIVDIKLIDSVQTIALNGRGDMFYTRPGSSLIYKLNGGQFGNEVVIEGVPQSGGIWLLEVDRSTGYLYICHDSGLYYLAPGENVVTRVPGFNFKVTGIGFDTRGNMFLGADGNILKMTKDPSAMELMAELEKKMRQRCDEMLNAEKIKHGIEIQRLNDEIDRLKNDKKSLRAFIGVRHGDTTDIVAAE